MSTSRNPASQDPPAATHCTDCGALLPDDAPEALCPSCLLSQVLDTATGDGATLDGATRDGATLDAETGRAVAPSPGTRVRYLGDYELLGEIGRGAMGVVYRARQESLGRTVAVKLLLGGVWASQEAVARFRAEARAAAGLRHPQIVAIHEVGDHDGQPYFSMDYVEGENLEAHLRDGPLDCGTAAKLVGSLAEAVSFAHGRGIIHRDLKPSNVLLDAEEKPHITDFGLAKNLAGEQGLTLTGVVLGTPGYMPPEQADPRRATDAGTTDAGTTDAETDAAGTAGDVYSLGAILYALMIGEPPFKAETPLETVLETVRSKPRRPRQRRAEIPRDLETICLRCLEKDPTRRYASAQALADDLGRFLAGKPISARPFSVLAVATKRLRPVAVAVAVAAVLGLLALTQSRGRQHERFLTEIRTEQDAVFVGRQQRLRQLVDEAATLRQEGDRWGALERLAEAARLEPQVKLRGAVIETLAVPGLRREGDFPGEPFARTSFSHDGKRLAIQGFDPQTRRWSLEVRDVATGERISRVDGLADEVAGPFRLQPGLAVVTTRSSGKIVIALWRPSSGELLEIEPPRDVAAKSQRAAQRTWSFSPSGHLLAFSPLAEPPNRSFSGPVVRDLRTGNEETLPIIRGVLLGFLDDQRVLYSEAGALLTWDLERRASASPAPTDRVVTLTRGSRFAVLRASASLLEVWDLRRRQRVARITDSIDNPGQALLSPRGRRLALGGGDAPVRLWDLERPERGYRTLRPEAFRQTSLAMSSFSPDDRLLIVAGSGKDKGQLWVWSTETGSELAALQGHQVPAWGPSSRRLATTEPGRAESGSVIPKIVLWDVALPSALQLDGEIGALVFEPGNGDLSVYSSVWKNGSRELTRGPRGEGQAPPPYVESRNHAWSLRWDPEDRHPESGESLTDFLSLRRDRPRLKFPLYPRYSSHIGEDGTTTETSLYAFAWAFEPGGRSVILGSGQVARAVNEPQTPFGYRLERWSTEEGNATSAWEHPLPIGAVAVSPDGKTAAVGRLDLGNGSEDPAISLWDIASGRRLAGIKRPSSVVVLAFSQDGTRLASSDFSGTFEVTTIAGEPINTWGTMQGSLRALALDRDGSRLAAVSDDGLLQLWNVASGRELARWSAHQGGTVAAGTAASGTVAQGTVAHATTALAFHPRRDLLLSGGSDGLVKVWNLEAIRAELAPLGLTW